MDKLQALHVTVIIPVFNEQERIAETLFTIKDYLSNQSYSSDLLIIDDGSSDLTSEVIKVVDFYGSEVKSQSMGNIVENIKNVGKGYSIAKGLLLAEGDVIVFTDADGSTPIKEIKIVLDKMNEGYDVVIGSRNLPGSRVSNRPFSRRMLSIGFNRIARILGLISVSDSQCGFKAYRKPVARSVAENQKTNGFCFDVEHLFIATKLGYSVSEVPVQWAHDNGSTLSLFKDSILMLFDLIRIRWLHRTL